MTQILVMQLYINTCNGMLVELPTCYMNSYSSLLPDTPSALDGGSGEHSRSEPEEGGGGADLPAYYGDVPHAACFHLPTV